MLLSDGQVLDSVRFNALIQDQFTNYQESLPTTFLNRTVSVNADDDEITSYVTGRVMAAAIIADDQEAPVYEAGSIELTINNLPNLKVGKRFSQAMISRLNRIRRNIVSGVRPAGDLTMFLQWEVQAARDLIRGINERKNQLILGMMLDSYAYDSLGMKLSGVTWGMPTDLKFAATLAWLTANAATATPITDILAANLYAQQNYGETYNRVTMTTPDFINMCGTAQFKNLIAGLVGQPIPATGYNAYDPRMRMWASELLKMQIETDDKLIFTKNAAGVIAQARVFPVGTLLFSNTMDDRSATAFDFGNAVVTESQVANIVGDPDNFAAGEQFGPFGYFTGKEDLNPPNLTAWGVARGFPRKFRKTCTAIMTGV